MTRTPIKTDNAPPAGGPYSQGIRAGNLVFCSGQLPIDRASMTIPEGIEAQTKASLTAVDAVLKAGGASLDSAVKTTVFLKNMNDFAAMNAVYATFFTGEAPARTTVEVARLPRDVLVEIEAIAVVTQDTP